MNNLINITDPAAVRFAVLIGTLELVAPHARPDAISPGVLDYINALPDEDDCPFPPPGPPYRWFEPEPMTEAERKDWKMERGEGIW